jgi:hypothetical protein
MNSNNAIEGVFLRFAERMVRVEKRIARFLGGNEWQNAGRNLGDFFACSHVVVVG